MRDNNPNQLLRVAGWSTHASGVASIIGIVSLIVFYVGFFTDSMELRTFGRLSDICGIIQYLLALPITLALHQLLKARAPVLSKTAMLIGIAGIIAFVILQLLLVIGVLSFAEQVGPVVVALLVVGVWLVITGYLGRSTGDLPHSLLTSILAVLFFGYPIWAFWLGRLLLSDQLSTSGQSPSMRGEIA